MTQFLIDLGAVAILFGIAIAIGVLLNVWSRRDG
jgi:hypothetical protein